jgi:hypothetical protein
LNTHPCYGDDTECQKVKITQQVIRPKPGRFSFIEDQATNYQGKTERSCTDKECFGFTGKFEFFDHLSAFIFS